MERADPMLVMVSSTGAVAISSPNAQQLEVMSSVGSDSPVGGATTPAPINPLLLASACVGSSDALDFLFRREDKQEPPMVMPTQEFLHLLTPRSLMATDASGDVEDGADQPAFPSASQLLAGVTAEGDTALHAVASHGDNREFLKCASIVHKRDQDLLFAVNKKGDTPLHCAARAGKSQMVSCLVELADSSTRLQLLRKENVLKETALHDAVHVGNKDIVERLLKADPELGNYPEEGASPLYLAILLERDVIAWTLHCKSNGNLSYDGPRGQNALHAAVLRGSGTDFQF